MRRVVVTGMGIVCSIGNNAAEVTESLRAAHVRESPPPTSIAKWAFAVRSTAA